MPRDRSPALPATIELHAAPYPCVGADWGGIPNDYSASATLSASGLGLPESGYDGTLTIADTIHAVYLANGAPSPTNATTLQTLANQIAADWWAWRTTAFDVCYAGIVAPVLDASVDEIVWTYRLDECSTRLKSAPWDSHSEQLNHSDPASDCLNCVHVYDPSMTVSGRVVSLPKSRICYENGGLVEYAEGVDTFGGCCNTPPGCQVTVTLHYRAYDFGSWGPGGGPIAGATVTISGAVTASGTTDSTGSYTTPYMLGSGASTITVSFGGCSYTGPIGFGTCPTLDLCFCAFNTTFTVAGPSDGSETVNLGGIMPYASEPFDIPLSNGAVTPIGTCVVSGSTYSFAFCNIDLCSNPLFLPTGVGITASAPGWVSACSDPFTAMCGVNVSKSVSLYFWETCYHDYIALPPSGYPQLPMQFCVPPCVPVATAQGYYPKTIQTRWTSVNATYLRPACNVFGPYEATWVSMPIISDTVVEVGFTGNFRRFIVWSSGCLSGGTFFGTSTDLPALTYGSVSITLTLVIDQHGGGGASLMFNRWHNGDCTPYSGGLSPPDCATAGYGLGEIQPAPLNMVCSPVDYSSISYDFYCSSSGCEFTIDVIEPSCSPAETPVVA